jgi:molybdate transport system ATP-binding protein
MRDLGVAHLAERRFLELSRGEQRRVLIARGVAFDPTVLLLDEPASGLDSAAREELDALIARIAPEVTLVCAAHVEADLPAVIERVVRLEHGRVVATGRRGASDRSPREGESQADEIAVPDPANETVSASGAREAKKTQSESAERARREALPLIESSRVNVWLGARHVLRDVTWRLDPLQHWLVTGANGSGKSTFLRLLHGQLRPAAGGEIRWPALGDPRNVWTLRRSVAWVSPELQAAYRFPTTVRDCVASGFESSVGLTRAPTPGEARRVDELLAELALETLADRSLSSLSYGQVRRALIARALANRPRLMLLDEPWEGLDEPVSAALNSSLAAVAAEGTQLVCASHLTAHRHLFTHEIALERGAVAHARPVP